MASPSFDSPVKPLHSVPPSPTTPRANSRKAVQADASALGLNTAPTQLFNLLSAPPPSSRSAVLTTAFSPQSRLSTPSVTPRPEKGEHVPPTLATDAPILLSDILDGVVDDWKSVKSLCTPRTGRLPRRETPTKGKTYRSIRGGTNDTTSSVHSSRHRRSSSASSFRCSFTAEFDRALSRGFPDRHDREDTINRQAWADQIFTKIAQRPPFVMRRSHSDIARTARPRRERSYSLGAMERHSRRGHKAHIQDLSGTPTHPPTWPLATIALPEFGHPALLEQQNRHRCGSGVARDQRIIDPAYDRKSCDSDNSISSRGTTNTTQNSPEQFSNDSSSILPYRRLQGSVSPSITSEQSIGSSATASELSLDTRNSCALPLNRKIQQGGQILSHQRQACGNRLSYLSDGGTSDYPGSALSPPSQSSARTSLDRAPRGSLDSVQSSAPFVNGRSQILRRTRMSRWKLSFQAARRMQQGLSSHQMGSDSVAMPSSMGDPGPMTERELASQMDHTGIHFSLPQPELAPAFAVGYFDFDPTGIKASAYTRSWSLACEQGYAVGLSGQSTGALSSVLEERESSSMARITPAGPLDFISPTTQVKPPPPSPVTPPTQGESGHRKRLSLTLSSLRHLRSRSISGDEIKRSSADGHCESQESFSPKRGSFHQRTAPAKEAALRMMASIERPRRQREKTAGF